MVWECISMYQKLSEPFIEKYEDRVVWNYVSEYQKLSESFIEKHKDKVNWYNISKQQKLTKSFIEKYKVKLDMKHIKKRCARDIQWLWRSAKLRAEAKNKLHLLRLKRDIVNQVIEAGSCPPNHYRYTRPVISKKGGYAFREEYETIYNVV